MRRWEDGYDKNDSFVWEYKQTAMDDERGKVKVERRLGRERGNSNQKVGEGEIGRRGRRRRKKNYW